MIFLDTHVALWLYFGAAAELSPEAAALIDRSDELVLSPISLLEATFLNEIGKISVAPEQLEAVLVKELDVVIEDLPLAKIVHYAHRVNWTRAPFDRMLVAQCLSCDAKLLTRDRTIRAHYPHAIW